MRIPVGLAWVLLLLTYFTAGLLRQFHDQTPRSPYVPPIVGSLLFASCFFLLLVAAREWRARGVPGRGIRLGSLTPILLMLLLEKWISLTLYNPLFFWISSRTATPGLLDAQFRAFAGAGLLLVCLLVSRFSVPTARKSWRRAGATRWVEAAIETSIVIGGMYLLLGAIAASFGAPLRLRWPEPSRLLLWIVFGQALLAFAEELYYRGLLMSETERLAPRLGARSAVARRWTALLLTSTLFGMEHLRTGPSWDAVLRQFVFAVSLALLFGLLVMVSANLHLAAGMHAWINWLLLGAAPIYVHVGGEPALPSGTYIGLSLVLGFALAYVRQRFRHVGIGRRAVS